MMTHLFTRDGEFIDSVGTWNGNQYYYRADDTVHQVYWAIDFDDVGEPSVRAVSFRNLRGDM